MNYQEILKDEAMEYASAFYDGYKRFAKSGRGGFKEHLLQICEFDNHFYYSLFYKYTEAVAKEWEVASYDLQEPEKKKKAVSKLKKDFLKVYRSLYRQKLEEEIDELNDELTLSFQDMNYYEKRLYIGEEELIGGKVSEEERDTMIRKEKEKQVELEKEIEILSKAKEKITMKKAMS